MKNLTRLANECMEKLDAIGIEYAEDINWEVNTRAKKRWGLCTRHSDGTCTISISSRLLADNVTDDGAINTIIHELLHTCRNGHGHGAGWKSLADKVNRAYGINIKRCSSAEEKGVESLESVPKAIKYQFECKECGKIYSRVKASNFTKNWQNYRCGCCGGEFKKIM